MQHITLGGSRRKNKTIKNKITAGILLVLIIFLALFKPQIKVSNTSIKLETPKPREIE